MKVQHIAVIFVIIILPITIITSLYISSQIDTITLQTEYNTKLSSATYGAVKAFQINTINNRYSTVSDSKIRDIEASINTFFNTLGDSENLSKVELQNFVPALVYTLYDGYYICSKYDNVMPISLDEPEGKIILSEDELKSKEPTYGLKTYINYSCRYVNGSSDFVVNYTLDNAINVYGKINGSYKTLSGYLIDPDSVTTNVKEEDYKNDKYPLTWKLKYNKIDIEPEILTEHVLFANEEFGDYEYVEHNGQKIYYDKSNNSYFYYNNYAKTYLINAKLQEYLANRTNNGHLYSTSAFEYYYNAKIFSENVKSLIGNISQTDAVNADGTPIKDFSVNTGDEKIFYVSKTNDPMLSGSTFNENRMAAIRKSIETNLSAAIGNYNKYSDESTYLFSMPKLGEEDWDKIANNVSIITFLQGIPIGHKYYNNYCVITNNSNEEVVKKENIYIITEKSNGDREYHLPGCKNLMSSTDTIVQAYANPSFIRQTVRISEGDYRWFYPQNIQKNLSSQNYLTACYYCIVNASDLYEIEQIMQGTVYRKE